MRREGASQWAVLAVAVGSVTLVQLPVFIGARVITEGAVCAVLLLCVAWGFPRQRRVAARGAAAAAFIYAACVALELIRGGLTGAYGTLPTAITKGSVYVSLVGFGITLVWSSRDRLELDRRLTAIALAPALYAFVSVVFHFAGLEALRAAETGIATRNPASLLGYVGVYMNRVEFPMSESVNSMGIVAGAGLAATLLMLIRGWAAAPRWMLWGGSLSCLLCLLLGDSRAALFIAVGIVACFTFIKPSVMWVARLLPVAVPVLPFLVMGALSLLNTQVGQAFSRGSDDFVTGTGRVYIWRAAWDKLLHDVSLEQLYGWGAYGHIPSGVSLQYAYLFTGQGDDPTAFTTHDIVIQTVLDGGYIALAILVAAVFYAARQLQQWLRFVPGHGAILALLGMLVVTVICGATEVSPGYGTQEALAATLLVMGAAAGLGRPPHAEPPGQAAEATSEREFSVLPPVEVG